MLVGSMRHYSRPGRIAASGWRWEGQGALNEDGNATFLTERGVSVVVCALDRPWALGDALDSVLRQASPGVPVETLVVSEHVPESPPGHGAGVRHIRPIRSGAGAARQAGLDVAIGAYVAWCDAGDAWTIGHLATLHAALSARPDLALVYADATGAPAPDFDPRALLGGNYIPASSALCRTAVAREVGGFDTSLRAGEEWDLWLRVAEFHTAARIPLPLTILAPRPVATMPEAQRDLAQVAQQGDYRERVIGSWRRRMAQRAGSVVPFDDATWSDSRRELVCQAPLWGHQSFGVVARALLTGLERHGVTIHMGPIRHEVTRGYERYFTSCQAHACLAFYYDYRHGSAALRNERIARYTMWEATGVPREQIEEINASVALLYVPCHGNLTSYLERGARVSVKVLPHGVDPAQWPLLDRPRTGDEPYTFGTLSVFSTRKGVDVLIRAFEDEFRQREHVRLLLKAAHDQGPFRSRDPRVEFVTGIVTPARLRDYLAAFDVFVLPSRGEGFGLTGLEAMATGLPLIATNWSGPADYLDPVDSFPLDYTLVNPGGPIMHHARFWGRWAEPSYEQLRARLRWCYEHRAEAAAMGRRASARVQRDWTWQRPAVQLYADLDLLARGVTPA